MLRGIMKWDNGRVDISRIEIKYIGVIKIINYGF